MRVRFVDEAHPAFPYEGEITRLEGVIALVFVKELHSTFVTPLEELRKVEDKVINPDRSGHF